MYIHISCCSDIVVMWKKSYTEAHINILYELLSRIGVMRNISIYRITQRSVGWLAAFNSSTTVYWVTWYQQPETLLYFQHYNISIYKCASLYGFKSNLHLKVQVQRSYLISLRSLPAIHRKYLNVIDSWEVRVQSLAVPTVRKVWALIS